MTASQASGTLVYRHEDRLFVVSAVLSTLVWLAVVVGTFGIALIYILFGALFYLFAQSAFIAMLRGNATRITPGQFPDLHARVMKCCGRLGIENPPEAFLLHADGAFNALATRFLGRNFVVLFSDVVDALESDPEALDFYIGHELGHIRRKHLVWAPLLWPASVLPLLGAAYSRAREYTCDLHGVACCDSRESAARGMAALAVGAQRWKSIDLAGYAEQSRDSGGFWMSFHELMSGYPWLSKRAARVLAGGGDPGFPSRSKLAWVLAFFMPRLAPGAGGAGSLLVMVAIIGILAAVAVPAYHDYTVRARVVGAVAEGDRAAAAVAESYYKRKAVPRSLKEAGVPETTAGGAMQSMRLEPKNGVIVIRLATAPVQGKAIYLVPSLDDNGKIVWECKSEDVPEKYLPQRCR